MADGHKADTTIDWPAALAEAQAAGLSIQQLADKLGCHRNQVTKKELEFGIRLKRLTDRPKKDYVKPQYDWMKILTEAKDAGMNCYQLSLRLAVSNATIIQAQRRLQIFLPKGRPKFTDE